MSHVLLADDDLALRDALKVLLGDAGHEVTLAGNGLEAVSAALAEMPDVIVSDIQMPVLKGTDAICMLRAIPRFCAVPVIFMSGEAQDESVRAARFLRKPFEGASLLDAVETLQHSGEQSRESPESACAMRPHLQHEACGTGAHAETERSGFRLSRGLRLVAEQEGRIRTLHRCGGNTGLALEVYEVLLNSVMALASFQIGNSSQFGLDSRLGADSRADSHA
jgi:CheY-like chemotaxis protein